MCSSLRQGFLVFDTYKYSPDKDQIAGLHLEISPSPQLNLVASLDPRSCFPIESLFLSFITCRPPRAQCTVEGDPLQSLGPVSHLE